MKNFGRTFYLVVLILAGVAVTGTVVLLASGGDLRGGDDAAAADCTLRMFGNRSGAYWACRVQAALQQNWFPDPIQAREGEGGGYARRNFRGTKD